MAEIQCTWLGHHTNDQRETIMIALQYVLTHNEAAATKEAIRERLKQKGFSAIVITHSKNGECPTLNVAWDISYKLSYWKINGETYGIYTNVIVK